MRIGIDCRTILNPGAGEQAGIGHYTHCLVRNLLKIDQENEYVLFFDNRISDSAAKLVIGNNQNVKARFFPFYQYKQYLPFAYSQMLVAAFLSREKLDLYHSPANVIPLQYSGKSVVTLHDLAIYKHPDWFPSNFMSRQIFSTKILVPKSLRKAKRIIAVSENTKQDIIKQFKIPAKKIEVVYEGVMKSDDLGNKKLIIPDKQTLKKKFDIKDNYILFLGTIEPRKNIAALVKAYHGLLTRNRIKSQKDNKNFPQLVLAGGRGWKYKEVFKTIKNLKLEKEIKYLDYVDHQDKIGLMQNALCFVFPSKYEGFGLPILEAMNLGIPVISSNVSSIPEVAGEAAILINPDSVSDLVQAIEKVVGDKKLREELSQKGREQSQKFSWQKTAEETLAIYKEVLSDK